MSFLDDAKVFIEEKTQWAFETCRSEPESVREYARDMTLGSWRASCLTLGAAAAGGALLPGPAALLALGAEIPALLNIFSRAANGVGWIKRGRVSREDYNSILAIWSGATTLDETLRKTVTTQAAVALASTAPKIAVMSTTAALTTALATTMAGKSATTAATYMAAKKVAAQLVSRLPVRMIPLVGFGVAAALNAYFVNSILDAAEQYYDFLETSERLLADGSGSGGSA